MVIAARSSEFVLTFDGPALADHRMAVADLAPSLLALGEIFHEANAIVNPSAPRVGLEVRAFDGGSFAVTLTLGQAHGIAEELVRLLNGQDVAALSRLIELIVGVGGVFGFLTWLRRHTVSRREQVSPGVTRLTAEDGNTLDVAFETPGLVERASVRRNARKVVDPLGGEGIDELRFAQGQGAPVVVEASDLDAFTVPETEDTSLTDEVTEMALAITVLPFTGGRKWRLSDGRLTFYAEMSDEEFLRKIAADEESFAKDDILRCRVRVRQWKTESGLKTEYEVVSVLEHLSSARTIPLDLPLTVIQEAPRSPRLTTSDPSRPQPSLGSEGKD